MKHGDFSGSLEASSDGLQASDLSRAMAAVLFAGISCRKCQSRRCRGRCPTQGLVGL